MSPLPKHFRYVGNKLHAENVPLARIAEKVGTPAYVYSKAALLDPLHRLQRGLKEVDHLICFAAKANSNLAILRLFARSGTGIDAVSGGELYRAQLAGVRPSKIVFSGVGKTEHEMIQALSMGKSGILAFNVESAGELETLAKVAERLQKKARVSLRLNPDVDPKTHPYISTGLKKNKFGLARSEAIRLAKLSRSLPWLRLTGASIHIGSQLSSLQPLREAYASLADFVEELRCGLGLPLRHLDLGGGLGIRYTDEDVPNIEDYCALIRKEFGRGSKFFRKTGTQLKLILEPGRILTGNAGVLLSRILYRKKGLTRNFLVIDAAMNDLIRPALYGARHRIVALQRSVADTQRFDVVGPACETSDVFYRSLPFPGNVAPGDAVALLSAGAYGFSMTSQYNSRPRPPEVLVTGGRFTVIRARETYDDLIRHEHPAQ